MNGDTVHPDSVERTLLAQRGPGILLAIDDVKKLADEEMKAVFDATGQLTRITKLMEPAELELVLDARRMTEPQGDMVGSGGG